MDVQDPLLVGVMGSLFLVPAFDEVVFPLLYVPTLGLSSSVRAIRAARTDWWRLDRREWLLRAATHAIGGYSRVS